MSKLYWYVLCIIVIIADQFSKYWVGTHFHAHMPFPLLPMLNITLAYNTGAAFSFLSGAGEWHRWFFAGFSLLVSAILLFWLYRTPSKARLQCAGISLILGGAIGNLIDRGLQGFVIDFIDFYYKNHHFATFNIADSAICLGAALLILDLLLNREEVSN